MRWRDKKSWKFLNLAFQIKVKKKRTITGKAHHTWMIIWPVSILTCRSTHLRITTFGHESFDSNKRNATVVTNLNRSDSADQDVNVYHFDYAIKIENFWPVRIDHESDSKMIRKILNPSWWFRNDLSHFTSCSCWRYSQKYTTKLNSDQNPTTYFFWCSRIEEQNRWTSNDSNRKHSKKSYRPKNWIHVWNPTHRSVYDPKKRIK